MDIQNTTEGTVWTHTCFAELFFVELWWGGRDFERNFLSIWSANSVPDKNI
jgi:hypothetical protein